MIMLIFILNGTAKADNNAEYKQALNTTIEAAYVQSGVDVQIKYKVDLIKQKIPKEYQKSFDFIVPVIDTLVKKRIEFKYEF